MKLAVISDIHGNFPTFDAVVDDAYKPINFGQGTRRI